MPSPDHPLHEALFHYYCEFDAIALLDQFADPERVATPGLITNFLGMKIPPKIFPPVLDALAGTVEGIIPTPGTWHADIAEWASALRAVDLAQERFRIIELGCGWGCWLVNTAVAARRKGLAVDLIGVEGDRTHIGHAAEVLALNGFDESTFALHHGIAAPRPGQAIFPDPEAGTAGWGGEAIFYPDEVTLARAAKDKTVQVLDCFPLGVLASDQPVDLLHIDIQGAETEFVEGNLDAMNTLVRRVLIGTHSRTIEGDLSRLLSQAGWRMEMDRPMIANLQDGQPVVAIDGVQMWMNPALAGP